MLRRVGCSLLVCSFCFKDAPVQASQNLLQVEKTDAPLRGCFKSDQL